MFADHTPRALCRRADTLDPTRFSGLVFNGTIISSRAATHYYIGHYSDPEDQRMVARSPGHEEGRRLLARHVPPEEIGSAGLVALTGVTEGLALPACAEHLAWGHVLFLAGSTRQDARAGGRTSPSAASSRSTTRSL